MNKFMEMYTNIILESRNDALEYVEKVNKAGDVTEVSVNITDNETFKELTENVSIIYEKEQTVNALKKELDTLKKDTDIKNLCLDLFDADDKYSTMRVEFDAMTVMFRKITKGSETKLVADATRVQKMMNEIFSILSLSATDLKKSITEIYNTYSDVVEEVKNNNQSNAMTLSEKKVVTEASVKDVVFKFSKGVAKAIQSISTKVSNTVDKFKLRSKKLKSNVDSLIKLTDEDKTFNGVISKALTAFNTAVGKGVGKTYSKVSGEKFKEIFE